MNNDEDLLPPDVIFWNSPLKWAILIYMILLFSLFYFGFKWYLKPVDCETLVKQYKDMNYSILIEKNQSNNFNFKIVGQELIKQKKVKIEEKNSPFLQIINHIEIGDTLEKVKGSLKFSLLKKQDIIEFDGLKVKCIETPNTFITINRLAKIQ
jgi:hypothetical protein